MRLNKINGEKKCRANKLWYRMRNDVKTVAPRDYEQHQEQQIRQ